MAARNFEPPSIFGGITKEDVRSCDRCVQKCANVYWESESAQPPPKENSGEESADQIINGFLRAAQSNALTERREKDDDGTSPLFGQMRSAGTLMDTSVAGSTVYEISKQLGRAPRLSAEKRHSTLTNGWKSAEMFEREFQRVKGDLEAALLQKIVERQTGILDGTSAEYLAAVDAVRNKHEQRKEALEQSFQPKFLYAERSFFAQTKMAEQDANQRMENLTAKRLKEIDDELRELGCFGPNYDPPNADIFLQASALCQVRFADDYAAAVVPVARGIKKAVEATEKHQLASFLLFSKRANESEAPTTFSVEQLPPTAHRLSPIKNGTEKEEGTMNSLPHSQPSRPAGGRKL